MRDVHLVKFEHVDRSAAIYLRKRTLDGAFPRTDMNDQPVTVNGSFWKEANGDGDFTAFNVSVGNFAPTGYWYFCSTDHFRTSWMIDRGCGCNDVGVGSRAVFSRCFFQVGWFTQSQLVKGTGLTQSQIANLAHDAINL